MTHEDNGQKFNCNICKKEFKHKETFRNHTKQIHGTGKKSQCDICDAWFYDKPKLEIHKEYVHENVKENKTTTSNKKV